MAPTFLAFALLISSLLSVTAAQQAWTPGQRVKTTSGQVVGMSSPKVPGVSQYLGIPFAQPPVGANRWVKPLNFSTTTEIKATKQAP